MTVRACSRAPVRMRTGAGAISGGIAQKGTAQDARTQEGTAQDARTQKGTAQEARTQEGTAQGATAQEATAQEATSQEATAQEATSQEPTSQEATSREPTTSAQKATVHGCAVRARPSRPRAPLPSTLNPMTSPRVAVVMGSDSDWPVMQAAAEALAEFGIACEVEVLSAHRTPDAMIAFGRAAAGRGIRAIIAGAGGAAHLPGMIASVTTLPVIGVPVPLKHLDGMDSLLSIVQMPAGIPVATVSIGGARNAGILAARIIGSTDAPVAERLAAFAADLEQQVAQKNAALKASLPAS